LQTKTDATGHFQLRDVPPDDYVIRAELEGYFGLPTNGNYPAFASQQVTVDAQQPVPEIPLLMVRGGTISGHVRDAEGKLQVNANVSAGVSVPANGVAGFMMSTTKTTDDRGEYRLFGLPPGEYYVASGGRSGAMYVSNAGGSVVRYYSGWLATPGPAAPQVAGQTFYPVAASLGEGTPVTLREGEDVAGIDIVMRPALPADAPAAQELQGRRIFRFSDAQVPPPLPPQLPDGRIFRK
jgi:hypothetical protein